MARTSINAYDAWRCAANGTYRIYIPSVGRGGNLTMAVEWCAPTVTPAGRIALSVDGDTGVNNSIDLSTTSRVAAVNCRPAFVDVDVTGLPTGGNFTLYFR